MDIFWHSTSKRVL